MTSVEKRLREDRDAKEITYVGHAFFVSLRIKDDKNQSQEFCERLKGVLVDDGYEVLKLEEAESLFFQPVPDGARKFSKSGSKKRFAKDGFYSFKKAHLKAGFSLS